MLQVHPVKSVSLSAKKVETSLNLFNDEAAMKNLIYRTLLIDICRVFVKSSDQTCPHGIDNRLGTARNFQLG